MRTSVRHLLIGVGVVTLLAGCGGSHVPTGMTGAHQYAGSDAALTAPRSIARTEQQDHGRSWMLPEAKLAKKLLYVSDLSTYDVLVYNYKTGAQVGKLTGLESPSGQCVDKAGNVWIVSTGADVVTEFARGGTVALATLNTDPEPSGCSVDPTTGNLAVAGAGSIDVFAQARGVPKAYQNTLCHPFWSPGYDSAGNLYAEALLDGSAKPRGGHSRSYPDPLACELPHGGKALRGVDFNGFNLGFPAGVMWDGKYLTLADQDYQLEGQSAIYRVTEDAAGNLTAIGHTLLADTCDGTDAQVPQPFIVGTKNTPVNTTQGSTVVGANILCPSGGAGPKFDYWRYPAGGNPRFALQPPPGQPVGSSVSIAP